MGDFYREWLPALSWKAGPKSEDCLVTKIRVKPEKMEIYPAETSGTGFTAGTSAE